MPKSRHPVDQRLQNREITLNFQGYPIASSLLDAITDGGKYPECKEIFVFGSRGDGKTITVMTGMIAHAQKHHAMGFALPVPWIGVADTFVSHKLKTVRSFENPIWQGGWRLTDQDHTATFWLGKPPVALVRVDLFGIEDQGAMDKLRMETVGIWFEEPAPAAVMEQSSGVSEDAWMTALTSRGKSRIPSHFYPAVASENYPDEDHWTWVHADPTSDPVFAHPEQFRKLLEMIGEPWPPEFDKYPQGTPLEKCFGHQGAVQWFRVPAGERASEADRLSWATSLASRPDLIKRLILGQPGVVMLGDQVAKGFMKSEHTTREPKPFRKGQEIYLGFDFGHTPVCVIGQPQNGTMIIKAGLYMLGAGQQQLMEELVLPWLGRFAPWILDDPNSAVIGYDPSQGTMIKPKGSEADIENAALTTIQNMLHGGDFEPGPIAWPQRKEVLTNLFRRAHGVLVEENPYTIHLIRALDGRAYYPKSHTGNLTSENQKKNNHPWEDLLDAFIYLFARYGLAGFDENRQKPLKVLTMLGNEDYTQPQQIRVLTNQN